MGQHTREVLVELLGFDDAAVERLTKAGVI
jgi:hypothetical protein